MKLFKKKKKGNDLVKEEKMSLSDYFGIFF